MRYAKTSLFFYILKVLVILDKTYSGNLSRGTNHLRVTSRQRCTVLGFLLKVAVFALLFALGATFDKKSIILPDKCSWMVEQVSTFGVERQINLLELPAHKYGTFWAPADQNTHFCAEFRAKTHAFLPKTEQKAHCCAQIVDFRILWAPIAH